MENSHNKQFKQIRNAWQFWFAVSFSVYGAMRRLGQCVAHYLIGRYAPKIGFTSMLLWRIRIISIF
ncbi:TPA: DUF3265 domain-containing protein [Vibrio parahaemolyticus]|nr:DUF3265 domain-containing protein [Vibrio parahaemolyticus]HCH2083809.1 DUF3265 domain-containing protein [Vibrio parahaemolyticus]